MLIQLVPQEVGYKAEHLVQPFGISHAEAVNDPPGSPSGADYIWMNGGDAITSFLVPLPEHVVGARSASIIFYAVLNNGPFEEESVVFPFLRSHGENFEEIAYQVELSNLYRFDWPADPATGKVFKKSSLMILEFGVRSHSVGLAGNSVWQVYLELDAIIAGDLMSAEENALLSVEGEEDLSAMMNDPGFSASETSNLSATESSPNLEASLNEDLVVGGEE